MFFSLLFSVSLSFKILLLVTVCDNVKKDFVLAVGLIVLCDLVTVICLSDSLITVMDMEDTFVCHLNTHNE